MVDSSLKLLSTILRTQDTYGSEDTYSSEGI